MKDAQKLDHVSLGTLIGDLRKGRFVIPDFQRAFEWDPSHIRELMKSIFRDYYIGSLLLWRSRRESLEALACTEIENYEGNGRPEDIVLDGQQRLTAMYYAFVAPDAPAPNRKSRFLFFISIDRFMEEDDEQAFESDWTRRGVNLLKDSERQYRERRFPLAVLGQGGMALYKWLSNYEAYWRGEEEAARQAGDENAAEEAATHRRTGDAFVAHVAEILDKYQVSYIELDRDIDIAKVCDIFTKINSTGIRLDVFDLLNALLRPHDVRLRHLWEDAQPHLEFVETPRMKVYILQVMSILRQQGYCSPKYLYYLLPGQRRTFRDADGSFHDEIQVADRTEFEQGWRQAVDAIGEAIRLLRDPREYGAIASKFLPYPGILPAFAAIQAEARRLQPEMRLTAQRKVRRWYWSSIFTNRYSGAVESTTATDYRELCSWFDQDSAEPAVIAEFARGLRDLELRGETRQGTATYNGIINLLVLNDARDWIVGDSPSSDLDDHHIVPQQWGREHELTTDINSILNRTLLTADTHRGVIGSDLPNKYLPKLIERNGKSAVRAMLESHLISPAAFDILLQKPFTPADFEAFVTERQRTIHSAIESLLIKERLDLAPQLRELDADIEKIELALRGHISGALGGDAVALKGLHFMPRVHGHIEAALRRNPALDRDYYSTLDGMLEYFDLRDLEDTIKSKLLWERFQARFGTKDELATRFQQLADLRNPIRHTRTVDEITRKDGEAAIAWFKAALEKERA